LLKAIAAMSEGLAMGPWDKKPQPSAGRLANHLEIHIEKLSALALEGVEARNYRRFSQAELTPNFRGIGDGLVGLLRQATGVKEARQTSNRR
jgi:hypothetical protein